MVLPILAYIDMTHSGLSRAFYRCVADRLEAFMKEAGGVNACAELYAKWCGRLFFELTIGDLAGDLPGTQASRAYVTGWLSCYLPQVVV